MTGENLLRSLELRLDNVVYRMGFAPRARRPASFVAHGHFAVNGRPTNIPSYQLKPGDRIEVRETHRAREPFKIAKETLRSHQAPEWLTIDAGKPVRGRRGAAIPRPDAARPQRAARGRVLLEVSRTHDRTREPADRACRGSRHVRQVRGRSPPGRLRRHARQRAAARPPLVARGSRGHEHPDPRRLPGVLDDPGRQGRRHPDRPERQEAPAQELSPPTRSSSGSSRAAPARSPRPTSPSRPTSRSSTRTSS